MSKIVPSLIAVAFALSACDSYHVATNLEDVQEIRNNVSFFKHSKSGLCFSSVKTKARRLYEVIDHSNVPCEADVEKNLKNFSDIDKRLVFFKEPKSGLCFSALGSETSFFHTVYSVASVPCTPAVLSLVR